MVPGSIEKDPENFEDMLAWLNNNKQGITANNSFGVREYSNVIR